ncbi:MAG: hypothetical protein HW387_393 [Parachlamydiales bacterium]|nr:hypothetical protein [Parachlamydiales bacterium]
MKKNHLVPELFLRMLNRVCSRKRLIILCPIVIISSLILAGSFGCSSNHNQALRDWMNDNGKIKVLSTTRQINDLVSEIGGPRIDSWTLIQGALDPHSYEMVKGDGEKIDRADIIFYNGLGLEHGASLSASIVSSNRAFSMGEWIQIYHPDQLLYIGQAIDPHIWMDISLWRQASIGILDRLIQFDPDGAEEYRERANVLWARMDRVHEEIRELLLGIASERRYFVTSHDAFQYFTRAYLKEGNEQNWADRFAAPEGLAPDGQLSPVDIQRILDFLQLHRVSVLFAESNVSRDSLSKIAISAREWGFQVKICDEPLYADAMDCRLHYLEMMSHNARTIAKNLEMQ